MKYIWLILYYCFAIHLPDSYLPIIGKISNLIRVKICKHIFISVGKNVIIQKGVQFGSGKNLYIGDHSSIGKNSIIPNNTKIGKYVMIAQDLYIVANNHAFEDISIPMYYQHNDNKLETVIKDDVWIGAKVIITPGKIINNGSIIGAGSIVTKNIPEYEIWAGNPATFIKSRLK